MAVKTIDEMIVETEAELNLKIKDKQKAEADAAQLKLQLENFRDLKLKMNADLVFASYIKFEKGP